MAAEQIWRRPLTLYVHGYSNASRKELWYCIDLESLPMMMDDEEVFPVFGVDILGCGWTIMGDHIYWAGKRDQNERLTPMILWRHNINTSPDPDPDPYSLELVHESERFQFPHSQLITLDGNRILFFGVAKFVYDEDEADEDYGVNYDGEVYDLNTGIWHNWAFNLHNFSDFFYLHNTLLMDEEQGKVKQLVFYNFDEGVLLFYHVSEDKFSLQHHPQFVLRKCDNISSSNIDELDHHAMNVSAVLMDSTLYWFTNELCLYGYDIICKRWFQSPPLKKEQLWISLACPCLVNVYNGNELVLLIRTPCYKLGIAFLAVSKQGKSLDVIVKSRHTLSVDPTFNPWDAIAMTSAATLKMARKLKTPGPDADSVSSPNPANRTPEDRSLEVVCRSSPQCSVIQMDREAQLVDISDESKGLSMHGEQMQSADREFELAARLEESEFMLGVLIANLVDIETELQGLLEENELLKFKVTQFKKKNEMVKLGMKNMESESESSTKISNELLALAEEAKTGERETMLEMKNMELESTKISNESLALVEAAKTGEREAMIKLVGDLMEEADKSSRMEELNAAQAANSEIETELRRLKVQRDLWRRAAEAAVSLLSTGNDKKIFNVWKASMLSTGNN